MPAELPRRRTVLKLLLAVFASAGTRPPRAAADEPPPQGDAARWSPSAVAAGASSSAPSPAASNFKAIYSDPALRAEFHDFLENVFHLYPEDELDAVIAEATAQNGSDRAIYEAIQTRLPEIETRLSSLTYALPALAKQKSEMARQTADLLGPIPPVRGYVEIGTPGRYVRSLRKRFRIDGAVYVVNDRAPALSVEDVVERGQLPAVGRFVPLGDYDDVAVPPASVDLVTNYIGFHHAPADRLDPFVRSIATALRPGGKLVVRDHDVDGERMERMVGLAHDVFNAGVDLSWAENEAQVRRFTSVPELEQILAAGGFDRLGGARLQDGDPTRNTLMVFVKRA